VVGTSGGCRVVTARGAVAAATRAFVAGLGLLSAQQAVAAAEAVRLAVLLDRTVDGSKAAALSRELRLVVEVLAPAGTGRDSVQRLQDEVARKRAQRAQSG